MDTLQQKLKRYRFLNELYNRGVESVSNQLGRCADEIMLINIETELQKRKELRDKKIDNLLKD